MKRVLLLAAVIALLPGCLATLGLGIGNTGTSATQPSVGPGGSFSSGGVSARLSDGPGYGGLVWAGVLGLLFGSADQRKPPELDSYRRVNDQDCRKPVENGSGNLRCN